MFAEDNLGGFEMRYFLYSLLLVISLLTIGCGSESSSSIYVAGEGYASDGENNTISIRLTVNTRGDIILSGEYARRIIGTDYLGFNSVAGWDKTLNQAKTKRNHLYILWENSNGEIQRDTYNIGRTFRINFREEDWVRRIESDSNDNIIVFVERDKLVEDSNSSSNNTSNNNSGSSSQPSVANISCSGAPKTRLNVGFRARVTYTDGTPGSIRPATASGTVLGKVPEGVGMDIIGGPVCDNGRIWWKVNTDNNLSGWISEGKLGEPYWLEPIN